VDKKQKTNTVFWVLAICIAATAVILIVLFAFGPGTGFKFISVEGSRLYYSRTVKLEKAQKVGDFMMKAGIFKNDRKIEARVENKDGWYLVSFVSGQDKQYTQMIKMLFAELLKMMREDVFSGENVRILICRSGYTECETVE
jgi:hypothetical protein